MIGKMSLNWIELKAKPLATNDTNEHECSNELGFCRRCFLMLKQSSAYPPVLLEAF